MCVCVCVCVCVLYYTVILYTCVVAFYWLVTHTYPTWYGTVPIQTTARENLKKKSPTRTKIGQPSPGNLDFFDVVLTVIFFYRFGRLRTCV